MLGKEKNVTNTIFVSLTPSLRFPLCMIYKQHLTGVSAAALRSFAGEWRDGAPHPTTQRTTKSSKLTRL